MHKCIITGGYASIAIGTIIGLTPKQASKRIHSLEKVDADIYRVTGRTGFKKGEEILLDSKHILSDKSGMITPVEPIEEPVKDDPPIGKGNPKTTEEDSPQEIVDAMTDDEVIAKLEALEVACPDGDTSREILLGALTEALDNAAKIDAEINALEDDQIREALGNREIKYHHNTGRIKLLGLLREAIMAEMLKTQEDQE